jgi:hypothetical protein
MCCFVDFEVVVTMTFANLTVLRAAKSNYTQLKIPNTARIRFLGTNQRSTSFPMPSKVLVSSAPWEPEHCSALAQEPFHRPVEVAGIALLGMMGAPSLRR